MLAEAYRPRGQGCAVSCAAHPFEPLAWAVYCWISVTNREKFLQTAGSVLKHAMCSKREGSEALCDRNPVVLGLYSVAVHAAYPASQPCTRTIVLALARAPFLSTVCPKSHACGAHRSSKASWFHPCRQRSRPKSRPCSRDPRSGPGSSPARAQSRRPPSAASVPQTSLLTSDKVQLPSSPRCPRTA